jgi:poly-gamma-glutamate synthesis protein (capsule biosynthesis protein)
MPPELAPASSPEEASLRLEAGPGLVASRWVYALVAPFPTLPKEVPSQALLSAWRGQLAGPFSGQPLLLDESAYKSFSALWGPPGAGAVQVLPPADLLGYAWAHRPSWGILAFEDLSPGWKVLSVDGQSPIHKDFDPAAYALSVPIALNGDANLADLILDTHGGSLAPAGNRDPGRMTVLAMTGVTALVRATAFAMERRGVLYPAGDIAPWLSQADLTHVSNEVPFARDCPYPNPLQPDMRFCSDPRYIALLEAIGTDIVELTGDHFRDWGAQAMNLTLDMYRERGWLYFGGGANLDEARQAITVEHNGNRLAFIGCNAKGLAAAGAKSPGAATCGYEWMQAEIARLRQEGYLPIATFQHYEYYTYQAQPSQIRDFKSMAQAGAVIVSGSQAHQPQAFEFEEGALIHYGLGNLFFDQYDVSPATRQAFIDRHVFYGGRFIGTELLTILFVDYARPRPMTADEREELLKATFNASGW